MDRPEVALVPSRAVDPDAQWLLARHAYDVEALELAADIIAALLSRVDHLEDDLAGLIVLARREARR